MHIHAQRKMNRAKRTRVQCHRAPLLRSAVSNAVANAIFGHQVPQKQCLSGNGARQVVQSNARAAFSRAKWLISSAVAAFSSAKRLSKLRLCRFSSKWLKSKA